MSTESWSRGEWAIQASGLIKRYGGRPVLRSLELNVPRGGVHGLLGPNGSGKTTTIRILLGLVRANFGRAHILGHEVPGDLPAVIGQVGAIVESPKFAPRMTGRHNLDVLADSIGVPRRRVTEVLLEVGLAADADRRFASYSLGMKQRLAIAATLLKSPELLIFDEPTNGLDIVAARDVTDFLLDRRAEGKTILLSTHIFELAEKLCDRVGIIMDGEMTACGTLAELTQGGTLEEKFFELYAQRQGDRA